jgi:2'-5' RNA ligase
MLSHPAYIVVEIPEPVRSSIQALRDSLDTPTARLPVEITLNGSSGVGPIPAGTDLDLVGRHLDRVLADVSPFQVRFAAIRAFPNTAIFYLEPDDRSPFDGLHRKLADSGIPFTDIPWPYNPHCTLRVGSPLSAGAEAELRAQAFPNEEFLINTVSIYQLDAATKSCMLLWQKTLGSPSGTALIRPATKEQAILPTIE